MGEDVNNGHAKISDYHVWPQRQNGYSWSLQLNVSGPDYKPLWKAELAEVSVEQGGYLIFLKEVDGVKEEKAPISAAKSCDPTCQSMWTGLQRAASCDREENWRHGARPHRRQDLGTELPWPKQEIRFSDGTIAQEGSLPSLEKISFLWTMSHVRRLLPSSGGIRSAFVNTASFLHPSGCVSLSYVHPWFDHTTHRQ